LGNYACSNDNLVGTICLFNFSKRNDQAEIGLFIAGLPGQEGMYYEANERVIAFGPSRTKSKLKPRHQYLENKSSPKLLEKFNFRKQESMVSNSNDLFITF
jgi:ribosomal-protein-alanine N-acetyltransferase